MSGATSLGIDLGTTSTKVLLLSEEGTVLGSASAEHGISQTSDGVEAEPARWWDSLIAALANLRREVEVDPLTSIGFSGNMSALVLLDEAREPVAPALLLADPRGADEIAALPPHLRASIADATGNEPTTVFTLSSLLWWSRHDPATLARAAFAVSAKDYVRARLTGVVATELTDAYNTLLVEGGVWARDTMARLGIPERLFPPLVPSDAVAGRVTAEAARLTGLPEGTPVAAGAGDVAATLSGLGGLPAGTVAVTLGTSAVILAPLGVGAGMPSDDDDAESRPQLGAQAQGALTCHPGTDGSWIALGSLLTGGLVVNWLRRVVGPDAIRSAGDVPDADDPLLFLPYLAGTGSPDFDSRATGTVLGVTPATRPESLVAAALEAVAFDLADLVERLEADGNRGYNTIVLAGGGTRVPAWPQIIADVTGRTVHVVDEPDLSAVGAAVLGFAAVGLQPPHGGAVATVAPRSAHGTAWAARRSRYVEARAAVLDLTHRLDTSAITSTKEPA